MSVGSRLECLLLCLSSVSTTGCAFYIKQNNDTNNRSHIRQALLDLYQKALSYRNPHRVGDSSHIMDTRESQTFHLGIKETVLLDQWTTSSWVGMLICCIGFTLLAIMYEGLKTARRVLFKRKQVRVSMKSGLLSETYEMDKSYGAVQGSEPEAGTSAEASLLRENSPGDADQAGYIGCSGWLWLQSLLHVIQVFTGYCLMLAFMTLNAYICTAVLVGAGLGHLIFGWFVHRKKTDPPEGIYGD